MFVYLVLDADHICMIYIIYLARTIKELEYKVNYREGEDY